MVASDQGREELMNYYLKYDSLILTVQNCFCNSCHVIIREVLKCVEQAVQKVVSEDS